LIRGSLPERRPGRQQWRGSARIDSDGASVYGLAYYDELRRFARDRKIDAPSVLAYVMAHEIGHLADLTHGPEGIMRQVGPRRYGAHEEALAVFHRARTRAHA
jgi:hypothetical protein